MLCTHGVIGSSPFASKNYRKSLLLLYWWQERPTCLLRFASLNVAVDPPSGGGEGRESTFHGRKRAFHPPRRVVPMSTGRAIYGGTQPTSDVETGAAWSLSELS